MFQTRTRQERANFFLSAVLDPLVEERGPIESWYFLLNVVNVLNLTKYNRQFTEGENGFLQIPKSSTDGHSFFAGISLPHQGGFVIRACPATYQGGARDLVQKITDQLLRVVQRVSSIRW